MQSVRDVYLSVEKELPHTESAGVFPFMEEQLPHGAQIEAD
jgi:hypothetical protein